MIIGWSGLFSALAELENENGVYFLKIVADGNQKVVKVTVK